MSDTATGQAPQLNHDILDLIDEFLKKNYRDEIGTLANRYPKDQKSLVVDWNQIFRFDPDLAWDVAEQPDYLREYFQEAVKQFDIPIDIDLSGVTVRYENLVDEREFFVGEYDADYIGELIGVTGQIRQISQVRPEIQTAVFECQRCGTTINIPQAGTDVQEPHECTGCERQGPFRLNKSNSRFSNHQLVRLELPPEHARGADSYLDVHLRGDLASTVNGDERVTITGELDIDEDGTDTRDFPWLFNADHIQVEEGGYEEIDFNEYRGEIEEISSKDDPIEFIASNVAPSLHRDEKLTLISEAFVCQLVGAAEKETDGGVTFRSNSHGFVVGDPGRGKSELLEGIDDIAPRSRYAEGESVSGAGLTAAAERTDFGPGEWAVKAGLLPKTNNGTVCMDELDKIPDADKKKLHSALQRQQIDFSKAGQSATLSCRTTLLAAGNPSYGRFDEYEPIAEQIDLAPALISRFDLIFTVQDVPEEEFDRNVAETVVESWDDVARGASDSQADRDLPEEAFQAYIAYARQNIEPTFTEEARERMIQEYVSIRRKCYGSSDDPIPLTARKLKAILRLSESVARTRLSDTVEIDDVKRAIAYVQASLNDVGVDPETGEFDADVVETGTSKSQRDRIQAVKHIIEERAEEHDGGAPADEVIQYATDYLEVDAEKVEHEIEKLKEKGEVYEPGTDGLRTS